MIDFCGERKIKRINNAGLFSVFFDHIYQFWPWLYYRVMSYCTMVRDFYNVMWGRFSSILFLARFIQLTHVNMSLKSLKTEFKSSLKLTLTSCLTSCHSCVCVIRRGSLCCVCLVFIEIRRDDGVGWRLRRGQTVGSLFRGSISSRALTRCMRYMR